MAESMSNHLDIGNDAGVNRLGNSRVEKPTLSANASEEKLRVEEFYKTVCANNGVATKAEFDKLMGILPRIDEDTGDSEITPVKIVNGEVTIGCPDTVDNAVEAFKEVAITVAETLVPAAEAAPAPKGKAPSFLRKDRKSSALAGARNELSRKISERTKADILAN